MKEQQNTKITKHHNIHPYNTKSKQQHNKTTTVEKWGLLRIMLRTVLTTLEEYRLPTKFFKTT